MAERTTCPTCGSPVVVAAGDEGTNHYVPANTRELTDALIRLDGLRSAAKHVLEAYMAGDPLGAPLNALEDAAGFYDQRAT